MEKIENQQINYSIIIPHYNIPDLLARCLRSIPEREDVQVIVIDDNSPGHKNYKESIPELSRKNVEFYCSEEGLGAGHARNIGLKHAKGKWLIFSDSDDFFVDNFSEILDEFVNDNHDIIFFNDSVCDSNDISRVYEYNGKGHIFKKYKATGNDVYFRVCYTEPWGKFIKRSVVVENNIKFQETKAHNDLLFAVSVGLNSGDIRIVDRTLYWYVIREGSLGHQKGSEPLEKVFDRIIAWNTTQQFLNEKGIKSSFYLPIRPCIKVLKTSVMDYFKLLAFMRRHKMRYICAFFDSLRYCYLRKMKKDDRLRFENMLIIEPLSETQINSD